jgi:signal transduction histidine kinase
MNRRGIVGIVDLRQDVAQAIEDAKEDLDKALAELDRIPAFDPEAIAFVAHAMSNYMHVTDAVLSLLKGALADHPDPEVQTWLEGLHHVSELTHQTIGRLLRVYEPGEMPLRFEHMRLEPLVERACDYHQRSAVQKGVAIACQYTGDIPRVWADRVAVAVVLDNLLSNAVKFSHAGGKIDVQILTGPGGAVCSVHDNGPGLTPLMQAQAFERGDISGYPAQHGQRPTGFGLMVSKAFIDRMGGRMWSESEPGKGACFSFRLPYDAPRRAWRR